MSELTQTQTEPIDSSKNVKNLALSYVITLQQTSCSDVCPLLWCSHDVIYSQRIRILMPHKFNTATQETTFFHISASGTSVDR